jgi:hypothetical protein
MKGTVKQQERKEGDEDVKGIKEKNIIFICAYYP